MPKFALFRNGEFAEVRDLPERPQDLPQKNIEWFPIGAPVEGREPGWSIVGGEAIQTIQPTPQSGSPTKQEVLASILERDRLESRDEVINAIADMADLKTREAILSVLTYLENQT